MASSDARPSGVSIVWVRLMYVAVYSSYGATSIYRTLYFRRVGLSGAQIGTLIAVQPLIMLAAGPLWSLLADRLGLRGRLLTVVTALSIVPMAATIWAQSYGLILALVILHALFQGPIQPLMDSIALSALGRARHRYATVRAYGSLGYAPVTWALGWFIQNHDIRWVFVANGILMGLGSLLTLRTRGIEHVLPTKIGTGLCALAGNRRWIIFMLAVFIALIVQGATFGYESLYMDNLGASESLIGLAGAIGSLSQTLLMLGALPGLLRRWGPERMMLLSLASYAVRSAIWALVPNAVVVAGTSLLLSFTFGAALIASVDFADRHAPRGLAATSQALVTGLVSGLGRSIGGLSAGILYDEIGPQATFGWLALLALIALSGFWRVWHRKRPSREPPLPLDAAARIT